MNEIIIRNAIIDDVYELALVRQKVWSTTYRGIYDDKLIDDYDYEESAFKFKERVEDKDKLFKVAVIDNKIIGYICFNKGFVLYQDYDYAINYLHILEDYQGRGLGTKFFKLIIEYAKENKINKFFVKVNKYNYKAHKYYEKMGGIIDDTDNDNIIYVYKVDNLINIDKANEVFHNYVNEFDLSNDKISYKYYHTLRVRDLAENIALSLNLSEEDISLAALIGILHDVGRFEQVKRYNDFNDSVTLDHADLGISILFDDNKIRDYIDNNKYDEIIKKAVYIHNKVSIPGEYKEKELLHSKIIRDADKLDILFAYINKFYNYNFKEDSVSKEVFDCIINKTSVNWGVVKTELDQVILKLAFIYDLNYPYSYNYLKKEKYIDKIIDNLKLKKVKNINIFNKIKELINEQLDRKGE